MIAGRGRAARPIVMQDAHTECLDKAHGLVRAAIVDDDDLPSTGFGNRQGRTQARFDETRRIVRWDDDRDRSRLVHAKD